MCVCVIVVSRSAGRWRWFAKLQGEDFEYYMQTYSILLGRNSKKSFVDVDLAGLGGGMNISRQHARIFYDFERRRFVLEVVGKNGCYVEGVLHLPGNGPVKLDSQDLLQIGDKKFYFLLPARKIARAVTALSAPTTLALPGVGLSRKKPVSSRKDSGGGGVSKRSRQGEEGGPEPAKKMRGQSKNEVGGGGFREKKLGTLPWNLQDGDALMATGSNALQMQPHLFEHHSNVRRMDAELEMTQDQLEEREMIGVVARVLQDLCAPGEWLPMSKLHTELLDLYHGRNLPQKVRRLVGTDDGSLSDMEGKGNNRPWAGLLNLLRRHPQHFIINTKLKGHITAEYVTLAGL
ncbi:unnamed protein product [Sphagnum jensenii]|uniref:FHA domain-containing protein n=1 Tax=Sphagnum jensenii TaxID=128206 RepID=A0ABP0WWQ5_9BRYO